jgi:hypothetical protein
MQDRDKESIYVRVLGLEERWELLNILEFNSDRKRMSVILRDPTTGTPLTSSHTFVVTTCVGHMSNTPPFQDSCACSARALTTSSLVRHPYLEVRAFQR